MEGFTPIADVNGPVSPDGAAEDSVEMVGVMDARGLLREVLPPYGYSNGWTEGDPSLPVSLIINVDRAVWDQLGGRARTILTDLMPGWVEKFITASLHYGDDNSDVLGIAGQYAEIWRKVGPLRRAMWEGKVLTREDPYTILLDLVGHAFLAAEMYRRGMPSGRQEP